MRCIRERGHFSGCPFLSGSCDAPVVRWLCPTDQSVDQWQPLQTPSIPSGFFSIFFFLATCALPLGSGFQCFQWLRACYSTWPVLAWSRRPGLLVSCHSSLESVRCLSGGLSLPLTAVCFLRLSTLPSRFPTPLTLLFFPSSFLHLLPLISKNFLSLPFTTTPPFLLFPLLSSFPLSSSFFGQTPACVSSPVPFSSRLPVPQPSLNCLRRILSPHPPAIQQSRIETNNQQQRLFWKKGRKEKEERILPNLSASEVLFEGAIHW